MLAGLAVICPVYRWRPSSRVSFVVPHVSSAPLFVTVLSKCDQSLVCISSHYGESQISLQKLGYYTCFDVLPGFDSTEQRTEDR
ncbi:hypothetical protein SprV_0401589300 [Sparganum proliferum]